MSRYSGARTIGRFRLFFLGLFLFAAAGTSIYQWFWLRPQKACEARNRWWHAETRSCGIPVWIPDLTGRPAPAGVERPPKPPY
jgi:hypothetical protein